jgi:hypothetical protein
MGGSAVSSVQAADGGSAEGDTTIPAAALTSCLATIVGGMKPIPKARREAAITAVRRHPKLKDSLRGRSKVLFVEPNLTGRGDEHPAQAVVGLQDYRTNRSIVAVVDTEAKQVVGVEELRGQLQLSDEERREANALAVKDKRVHDFLAGRDLNALTRLYFPPAGDESHRYAIVFARPDTSQRRYAVIDLTERKVVDVLENLATRGAHGD